MIIEVFVPVLFKFKDDKIVFTNQNLQLMQSVVITNDFAYEQPKAKTRGFDERFEYQLTDSQLTGIINSFSELGNVLLKSVELYYYHHRVVFKYTVQINTYNNELPRSIRSIIDYHYNQILQGHIIPSINSLINNNGDQGIPAKGEILSYYSYLLMLIPGKRYFPQKITNFLGTLTFRIVESSTSLFKYGHFHYVRISIPSIIIYYKKYIGPYTKIDIINAIYQCLLYTKKSQDNKSYEGIEHFSDENIKRFNRIEEDHLVMLWDYFTDSLGGKMIDIQNQQNLAKSFSLSILALLVATLSFILTLVIPLLQK